MNASDKEEKAFSILAARLSVDSRRTRKIHAPLSIDRSIVQFTVNQSINQSNHGKAIHQALCLWVVFFFVSTLVCQGATSACATEVVCTEFSFTPHHSLHEKAFESKVKSFFLGSSNYRQPNKVFFKKWNLFHLHPLVALDHNHVVHPMETTLHQEAAEMERGLVPMKSTIAKRSLPNTMSILGITTIHLHPPHHKTHKALSPTYLAFSRLSLPVLAYVVS